MMIGMIERSLMYIVMIGYDIYNRFTVEHFPLRQSIWCFFKFHLIVDVEESIVNALYRLRITDQLFESYVLYEWCVHNCLFDAYFEVKFKKIPNTILTTCFFTFITKT
jgi:hypothetical protein